MLADVLQGRRLPDPALPTDLVLQDASTGQPLVSLQEPPRLDAAALPGAAVNQAVLQLVAVGPLPGPLAELYGSWMEARLALARADFLQGLARVPNLWSATSPATCAWFGAQRAGQPFALIDCAASRLLVMSACLARTSQASELPAVKRCRRRWRQRCLIRHQRLWHALSAWPRV